MPTSLQLIQPSTIHLFSLFSHRFNFLNQSVAIAISQHHFNSGCCWGKLSVIGSVYAAARERLEATPLPLTDDDPLVTNCRTLSCAAVTKNVFMRTQRETDTHMPACDTLPLFASLSVVSPELISPPLTYYIYIIYICMC
ncbi:hypothetical protein L249_0820, partial [Ophiocordyceps polyrhachis-furcata BCC 54312]